ncbi:MAG: aminopeptidase [Chlamydiia bacterium]|nr:aminopeptidase [Chlamydiia bacterium]
MTFEEQLQTYAELIVKHGANVQKGQDLYITSEPIHRDFVALLVETAYKAGARTVIVDLADPLMQRLRILHSQSPDYLSHVPEFIPYKFDQMIPSQAASIRILGSEEPDLLEDLDAAALNGMQLAVRKKLKNFYEQGIGHSKVQWTIAAASTPKWAEKVYPGLNSEEANRRLWDDILKMCRADKPDCLELWQKHNDTLQRRARKLTELKIDALHFVGPGTDLLVGLSDKARFRGGSDKGPRGASFEPNLPTEEVFTPPDWRRTQGFVRATRPFLINGVMIRDLKIHFDKGEIVEFSASEGEKTFREYIGSDPGAKRLGEVALVGVDSPIYQTGKIFEEILFDENAACHIAVGFAYHFCIEGSAGMSLEELDATGVNTSHVHTDMMISSEEVDVFARMRNGDEVPLLKKGQWVSEYA